MVHLTSCLCARLQRKTKIHEFPLSNLRLGYERHECIELKSLRYSHINRPLHCVSSSHLSELSQPQLPFQVGQSCSPATRIQCKSINCVFTPTQPHSTLRTFPTYA